MLILILLSLMISIIASSAQRSVTLYYHQWCQKCRASIQIFDKLQQNFKLNLTISSIKIIGQNEQLSEDIYQKDQIERYQKHQNLINVYPTIVFDRCTNYLKTSNVFTYQNDLNLIQLSYWIQVSCLQKIPACSKKIQSGYPTYQIPSFLQDQLKPKVILWAQENPLIRICTNSTLNGKFNTTLIAEMLADIKSVPLFFDKFTHNIRNYLIKTQKTAIVSINRLQDSQNAKSFKQYYTRVTNFKNESLTNTGFKIQQADIQKLVFIQVNLYNKKGKQNKIGFKLVQYLEQANFGTRLTNNDIICAIRFKDQQFIKNVYDSNQQRIVKGNKFSYWVHQMVKLGQNQQQNMPIIKQIACLKNYIVFRYSIYDLSAIKQVIKLERTIKQSVSDFQVIKMRKKWWSQAQGKGITFCKEGEKPVRNISVQQATKLTYLRQQLANVLAQPKDQDL